MTDTIRLGVIGLGAEGGLYANLISGGKTPHVEIGAIWYSRTSRHFRSISYSRA